MLDCSGGLFISDIFEPNKRNFYYFNSGPNVLWIQIPNFLGNNSEGPAENSWVLDLCPAK
jgi:hypothetical protein